MSVKNAGRKRSSRLRVGLRKAIKVSAKACGDKLTEERKSVHLSHGYLNGFYKAINMFEKELLKRLKG